MIGFTTRIATAVLVLLLALAAAAPAQAPAPAPPVKCTVGAFIMSLYDLDARDGSFGVDYWLWFTYTDTGIKPLETVEYINTKTAGDSLASVEDRNGTFYACKKVKATVIHDWAVEAFPFDRQVLRIIVEESNWESSRIQYVPDTAATNVSSDIALRGWKIDDVDIKVMNSPYDTTFGDPRGESEAVFTRAVISITLVREATGMFFKLHGVLYIAMAVVVLALFMKPADQVVFAGRVGLIVSMLFAAIINQCVVEASVGETVRLSLSAKIHILTFVAVFAAILITFLSRRWHEHGQGDRAIMLDRVSALVLPMLYAVINVMLIFM
ncbi:MAG: hypothetical protein ABIF71_11365 [Planctomycetota bacterium]